MTHQMGKEEDFDQQRRESNDCRVDVDFILPDGEAASKLFRKGLVASWLQESNEWWQLAHGTARGGR